MGKQVRFYMLPEDEANFLGYVLRNPKIRIIKAGSFRNPTPEFYNVQSVMQSQTFYYYFWNTAYPIEYLQISQGERKRINLQSGTEETEVAYFVGSLGNIPLIEYTRSDINKLGHLRQGRLWADMYATDGVEFIYKGEEFENWYNELAQWLRGNLKRAKGVHDYIGKEALKWHRDGGFLDW